MNLVFTGSCGSLLLFLQYDSYFLYITFFTVFSRVTRCTYTKVFLCSISEQTFCVVKARGTVAKILMRRKSITIFCNNVNSCLYNI